MGSRGGVVVKGAADEEGAAANKEGWLIHVEG